MSLPLLPIQKEPSGPFAGMVIVRLEQPGKPVIVLDHELIQRMEATFRTVQADKAVRGLVLASAADRVFVAGADLKAISEWDDAQLLKYLEYAAGVFGMLARMPFPTAAAINGAALGGGLELAMHCDGVIAAPPPLKDGQPGKAYPVGLPEAGLGLCPGWGGTNLLPARMDPADAITRTAAGKPMLFDEAAAAGVFDRVAPDSGKLIATAMQWLAEQKQGARERDGAPRKWIGRPACAAKVLSAVDVVREQCGATEPGAAVCSAVDAGLSAGWDAALAVERRELVRLRHTPAAKQSLEAFFSKTKK